MKKKRNLWVIPTDKPSRLAYYQESTSYSKPILQLVKYTSSDYKPQNIYITSDEEIKEGDWCYNSINNNVYKKEINKLSFAYEYKIILTTDSQLIQDGVQFIDDEFLEWICKNPSCEYAIVDKENWMLNPDVDFFYKIFIPNINIEDKIIIPKEEPKSKLTNQKYLDKIENDGITEEFLKEETLEEAVKEELENHFFSNTSEIKQAEYFINFGAKWQQERSYSEEEVVDLLQWLTDDNSIYSIMYGHKKHRFATNNKDFTSKEILEKFKKK